MRKLLLSIWILTLGLFLPMVVIDVSVYAGNVFSSGEPHPTAVRRETFNLLKNKYKNIHKAEKFTHNPNVIHEEVEEHGDAVKSSRYENNKNASSGRKNYLTRAQEELEAAKVSHRAAIVKDIANRKSDLKPGTLKFEQTVEHEASGDYVRAQWHD